MVSFFRKASGTVFVRLFFHEFEKCQLFFWSVAVLPLPKNGLAKCYLSRPGFEHVLPRPQRNALTTRPSGLEQQYMN